MIEGKCFRTKPCIFYLFPLLSLIEYRYDTNNNKSGFIEKQLLLSCSVEPTCQSVRHMPKGFRQQACSVLLLCYSLASPLAYTMVSYSYLHTKYASCLPTTPMQSCFTPIFPWFLKYFSIFRKINTSWKHYLPMVCKCCYTRNRCTPGQVYSYNLICLCVPIK